MRPEHYTAEAICQAMSLAGFVESQWAQLDNLTLRVLLTPSFDPEVCITFARTGESASLSVVALAEQFWTQRGRALPQCDREVAHLPLDAFEDAAALFRAAHAASDPDHLRVGLDGMGSESCLVSRAGTLRLRAHVPGTAEAGRLVARVIELAWGGCGHARVRNALAQAARYLSVEYPLQDVPGRPPVTQVAMVGTPSERHDYLEMLRGPKKDGG